MGKNTELKLKLRIRMQACGASFYKLVRPYILEGMSTGEIAEKVIKDHGVTGKLSTVKTRVSNARRVYEIQNILEDRKKK